MAIDPARRAKLSASVTGLSPQQAQALKDAVAAACGHAYNEVQQHAWGLCACGEAGGCPPWVEEGFAKAEELVETPQALTATPPASPFEDGTGGGAQPRDGKLGEVLDETALQMTGLLRGVVVDQSEIKSSKASSDSGVFEPVKKNED